MTAGQAEHWKQQQQYEQQTQGRDQQLQSQWRLQHPGEAQRQSEQRAQQQPAYDSAYANAVEKRAGDVYATDTPRSRVQLPPQIVRGARCANFNNNTTGATAARRLNYGTASRQNGGFASPVNAPPSETDGTAHNIDPRSAYLHQAVLSDGRYSVLEPLTCVNAQVCNGDINYRDSPAGSGGCTTEPSRVSDHAGGWNFRYDSRVSISSRLTKDGVLSKNDIAVRERPRSAGELAEDALVVDRDADASPDNANDVQSSFSDTGFFRRAAATDARVHREDDGRAACPAGVRYAKRVPFAKRLGRVDAGCDEDADSLAGSDADGGGALPIEAFVLWDEASVDERCSSDGERSTDSGALSPDSNLRRLVARSSVRASARPTHDRN